MWTDGEEEEGKKTGGKRGLAPPSPSDRLPGGRACEDDRMIVWHSAPTVPRPLSHLATCHRPEPGYTKICDGDGDRDTKYLGHGDRKREDRGGILGGCNTTPFRSLVFEFKYKYN